MNLAYKKYLVNLQNLLYGKKSKIIPYFFTTAYLSHSVVLRFEAFFHAVMCHRS